MGTFAKEIQKARQMARRNRSAVACARCKATKSKCSDYRPCKHCASVKVSCEELLKNNQTGTNSSYPDHVGSTPEPFNVDKALLSQQPMAGLKFSTGPYLPLNPAPIASPNNLLETDSLHLSLAIQLAAFGHQTARTSEPFGQLYSASTSNNTFFSPPISLPPAVTQLLGLGNPSIVLQPVSHSPLLPLGPSFLFPQLPVLPPAAAMDLLFALAATSSPNAV